MFQDVLFPKIELNVYLTCSPPDVVLYNVQHLSKHLNTKNSSLLFRNTTPSN